MTLVGNTYTFNLKNHKVFKLKWPSIKDWQSIYLKVGQIEPPQGLIGLNRVNLIPDMLKVS